MSNWLDLADGVASAVEGTFGEDAVWTPALGRPGGGVAVTLPVAFDAAHEMVEAGGDGPPFSTTAPAALVRNASLPAGMVPARRDRVCVRGTDYAITDIQPDGHAARLLILREV